MPPAAFARQAIVRILSDGATAAAQLNPMIGPPLD